MNDSALVHRGQTVLQVCQEPFDAVRPQAACQSPRKRLSGPELEDEGEWIDCTQRPGNRGNRLERANDALFPPRQPRAQEVPNQRPAPRVILDDDPSAGCLHEQHVRLDPVPLFQHFPRARHEVATGELRLTRPHALTARSASMPATAATPSTVPNSLFSE